MDKDDIGQYSIQNHLKCTKKKLVRFLIEENSVESTKNSQSDLDFEMKERMILVMIKLGAKLKCKDNKKYIEEGLEKIVILVQ